MRYLLFTILLFFSIVIFSQPNKSNPIKSKRIKNVYLDIDLSEIDSTLYTIKCRNRMHKCLHYSNDSLSINAVYPKFKFGKLSGYSNKRIRKEIYRNKDFKGNIIIHYAYRLKPIDSILEYKRFRKFDVVNIKMNGLDTIKINDRKKVLHELINKIEIERKKAQLTTREDVISDGKKLSKKNNKCIKKLKNKFDVDVFHYYFSGTPECTKDLHWIKDKNRLIKNYFFKYNKQFYFVIIKPDGEYLLIGDYLITPQNIKKLLKNSDWTSYKEDLKKSEKNKKPFGFFNMPHIHNCL